MAKLCLWNFSSFIKRRGTLAKDTETLEAVDCSTGHIRFPNETKDSQVEIDGLCAWFLTQVAVV